MLNFHKCWAVCVKFTPFGLPADRGRDSRRTGPVSRQLGNSAGQSLTASPILLVILLMGSQLAVTPLSAQQVPTASSKPSLQPKRPRLREAGLRIGVLPPGRWNAITDVSGVQVGHVTLRSEGICTGVTVILPHSRNVFQQKVPAAYYVGNGFGKLVGTTQIGELGTLETPIVLTNTLAVFEAANGLIDYTLSLPGNEHVRSVNPVVGETNDGYLNRIRERAVQAGHVREAIRDARSGPVSEGCVGAGTGTVCFGYKGGIGTSSRRMPEKLGSYTVGVLVQTNFGGSLTIAGVPVGQRLGRYYLKDAVGDDSADGSCMIVIATNAPVDARQLTRLSKRAILGLAATGSPMTHGSGDYVLAFSTVTESTGKRLSDSELSPLFQAVREATEEAILNSLFQATTTTGYQRRTVEALPLEKVIAICREAGAIGEQKSDSTR